MNRFATALGAAAIALASAGCTPEKDPHAPIDISSKTAWKNFDLRDVHIDNANGVRTSVSIRCANNVLTANGTTFDDIEGRFWIDGKKRTVETVYTGTPQKNLCDINIAMAMLKADWWIQPPITETIRAVQAQLNPEK